MRMSEDTVITPVGHREETPAPIGRSADKLSMIIAGLGAALSITAAIWFFAGFAENDTRPEHLASALVLTIILFAFAIIPFGFVAWFAWRAFKSGTKRAHLLWTIFLMIPWVFLGSFAVSHTPLPNWCGIIIAGLAGLLCLWAAISLILDRHQPAPDTERSRQNEMTDDIL